VPPVGITWQAAVPWLLLPSAQPVGCETHMPVAPVHFEVGPQPVLGKTGCFTPVPLLPLAPLAVPEAVPLVEPVLAPEVAPVVGGVVPLVAPEAVPLVVPVIAGVVPEVAPLGATVPLPTEPLGALAPLLVPLLVPLWLMSPLELPLLGGTTMLGVAGVPQATNVATASEIQGAVIASRRDRNMMCVPPVDAERQRIRVSRPQPRA
jgi:hypothetical protein